MAIRHVLLIAIWTMKLLFLTLTLLTLAPAALAQSAGPDGLSGDSNSNEVFSGSGVDFYDLIHSAGRLNTNPADFNRQQQRRLPGAIEDFRLRQQEALQQEASEGTVPVSSSVDIDETVIME